MTEPSVKAIDRLAELVAASREINERRIAALEQVVEKSNQNIARAVEEIKQSAFRIEQSAERVEQQVGLMSEHLTAIDIKIERLADRIDELRRAVDGHLEVAKQQSLNIAELTKLVATQANTFAMLLSRTGS